MVSALDTILDTLATEIFGSTYLLYIAIIAFVFILIMASRISPTFAFLIVMSLVLILLPMHWMIYGGAVLALVLFFMLRALFSGGS